MTEQLILANPTPGWVTAHISYLTANGRIVPQTVGIPGYGRVAVNVNAVVKQALHATMIIANGQIVAERQDFFVNVNGAQGSTTVMGASDDSTSWYLAQGLTAAGTTASLDIANPGSLPTTVQVVYYQAKGAPIIKTYILQGDTRLTVNMTSDAGINNAVGVAVYATTPVVVEQTMFFHANGVSGGFASVGFGV